MKQTIDIIENIDISLQPSTMGSQSSVINRTPIAGAHTQYRSQVFTAQTSINPLIAAAEPLIALNNKLKQFEHNNQSEKLYQTIVHEINAFETNAQKRGFRAETILIARYVLCATLDETLLQMAKVNNQVNNKINDELSNQHNHKSWPQGRLLNTFHQEDSANERFFLLLARMSEEPSQHLELLELMYLCLSLGFEGKFRSTHHGRTELNKIIDALYHRIRQQREEPKPLLQAHIKAPTPSAKAHKRISLKTLIATSTIATILLLMIIYLGFAYMFDLVTTPMQQQVNNLTPTNTSAHLSAKLKTNTPIRPMEQP